jgi:hypothetical protein
MQYKRQWLRRGGFIRQFINICLFSVASIKESLLKGKDRHCWPPCTNKNSANVYTYNLSYWWFDTRQLATAQYKRQWLRWGGFIHQFINICFSSVASIKESLLKGKDRHCWPPCTNKNSANIYTNNLSYCWFDTSHLATAQYKRQWLRRGGFIHQFINICLSSVASIKESLLKTKDRYGWPTCTYKYRGLIDNTN